MHREMLALQLQRPQLIDQQIAQLNGLIALAMKPHQDAHACLQHLTIAL